MTVTAARSLQKELVRKVAGLNASLTHNHLAGQELLDGENAAIRDLSGPDTGRLFDRTAEFLRSGGWTVARGPMGPDIDPETKGWTRPDLGKVLVRDDLNDATAAAVLLHEAGHIALGHGDSPIWKVMFEALAEVEAESVAFLVAGMHGLDTSPLSVGYIAGWAGGDPEHVRETADRVIAAAQMISDGIDHA